MRLNFPRILLISLLYFFLVSCATVSQPTAPAQKLSWQDRQIVLNRIHNWQLNGKIAVQTAQDSGSASVEWLQKGGRYTISLTGPLGAGGLKLAGQPGAVTLDTSDGKHLSANSPEQLLSQAWGWNLPVSNMNYWARGLPVPGIPSNNQFDSLNRLTSLRQQGWTVQFLSYANNNNVDLPNKIYITSPALKAKIIIYEWNTHISH